MQKNKEANMSNNHLKQDGRYFRHMLGRIIISGTILCKSGIHIGGSSDTIEIGGIDKPVIRNPITHEPYIPGSSLKGKLRSIIEKIVLNNGNPIIANKQCDDKGRVYRHECESFEDAKDCPVCRMFGSVSKEGDNYPSPLRPRDCYLEIPDDMKDDGVLIFEAKTENALDRLTSSAQPRTIERVPAGAKFNFEIVYNVEMTGKLNNSTEQNSLKSFNFPYLLNDITHLLAAMNIIEKDGLGGNISRGYGAVEFQIKEFKVNDSKGNHIDSINTIIDDTKNVYKTASMIEKDNIVSLIESIKNYFSQNS